MSRRLERTKFKHVDLSDPFFDSLKQGYGPFPSWFAGKAEEDLYVVTDGTTLSGMIYLKEEDGPVDDVAPPLPSLKWLKVGTLKIDGKGTLLGERVIKKIFDTAIDRGRDGIYVTVFAVHQQLIALFTRYGFEKLATKSSADGIELVLARRLDQFSNDILKDYPFIHTTGRKAWLLAIYPEYHTRLLPDSILNNEPVEIVQDVSHTNTIHKVYIAKLALTRMSPGDVVVFYRTTDHQAPAHYRSVVSSVCVVEEIRSRKDFGSLDAFLAYTKPRSVFSQSELIEQWTTWSRLYVAKLTYNGAFNKRVTRGQLIDEGVLAVQPRWDLRELTPQQLNAVLTKGQLNARLIVD